MSRKLAWTLIILWLSVPAVLAADSRATTTDPVADGLVEEALQKNPDVRSASAVVDAVRARITPALTLPDPFIGTTYQAEGSSVGLGEMPDNFAGFMFSQPVPWPGKLRLSGLAAESEATEAELSIRGRVALSIEARVRRTYYDLLLARAQLELIEERRRSWEQIEGVVRERYALGLGVQQDVLRTQIELIRLGEARADQEALVVSRLAELNRVVGRPQQEDVATPATLAFRDGVPSLGDLLAFVRRRSPELKGANQSVSTRQIRIDLAKRDFLPDFVLSGGPMYRGALDPMWQVGVGITVPLYARSRQQNRLLEQRRLLDASEADARSVDLELEMQTRERHARLVATQQVAKLYLDGVLPLDQLSLEAATSSYRTGKVPFVTVLEALNALYADRSLLLNRLADAEKWRVAIDEASLQPSGGMSSAVGGMSVGLSTAGMNGSATMGGSPSQPAMPSGNMK